MKLISWNVNGLRAATKKGFYDFYKSAEADIFCIQETKMQESQIDENMKKITKHQYWNSAEKKGYSGTAVFTMKEPISVINGIRDDYEKTILTANNLKNKKLEIKENDEGRLITCEYENFFLVNCYVPNSKRGLERLEYRQIWEDEMIMYLETLDKIKPVIYCGDLNVAHQEIDLKNPSSNHRNAGFTDEEREKMSKLLNAGFVDSFRYLYPDKEGAYTWWSYMFHARENNAGWRIDYFIVSDRIKDKIKEAKIHSEVMGSDHCPIELNIDI